MTDVLTSELTPRQREQQAQRRIERFVSRFDPTYYELVCHAALPLVLTPELVSYLRNEFLPGLPWMAEVDLLLSDLCAQVGYELYVMDVDVRAYVLKARSDTFDAARMKEVANLLISYVRYLANNSSQMGARELESQQWAAMVYLSEEAKRQVVDEIAERFQACSRAGGGQVGAELLRPAEMTQLAEITQNFREQLADYPALIEYASLVSDVQLRNIAFAEERIEQVYEVGGRQLQLPAGVKESLKASGRIRDVEESPTLLETAPSTSGPSDVQLKQDASLAFPPLETLNFVKGELVDALGVTEETFPPPLKTLTFQVATVSLPQQRLEVFEFQTAKIERERAGLFRRMQWVIKKSRAQARRFVEPLADDLTLEMVAIPGGQFLMGSPEDEPDRFSDEGPHDVTVPDFFMGRYPVTQAQWRFVANLPQINRELALDPSRFKESRLPVERVFWYEAVEFCDRLTAHTDRTYRLPSEAEWEYACRAGTTTPFHFGNMILTDVANYNGNYAYAEGPKGRYRKKTTPVDEFNLANVFGLADMHGNVLEWCQDHWHDNYQGAPIDGSAWLTNEKEARRVRRGGSWSHNPRNCRSAYRNGNTPDYRFSDLGFRVSCSAPRT